MSLIQPRNKVLGSGNWVLQKIKSRFETRVTVAEFTVASGSLTHNNAQSEYF